jgi:hypothetical protein
MTFSYAEEVLVDGVRYTIAGSDGHPPTRYRLLATTPHGPKIVWAAAADLRKIDAYTRSRDDTDHNMRFH